jgi:hypothetical protein
MASTNDQTLKQEAPSSEYAKALATGQGALGCLPLELRQ